MKSLSSPGRVSASIEPLEARIAPAVLLVGNPNSTQDLEYSDSPFVNLATGQDGISTSVRDGGTVAGNAYYLYLSGGDELKLYNTTNGFEEYFTVKAGNVVAFFIDSTTTGVVGEVDAGELVSLSLGRNANVTVSAGLSGDVVTNLDEKGTLSSADDSISMTGLVSDQQGIKGVTIGGGNVNGKIMAGGDIKNISVNGTVGAILAGAAVNRLNPAGESFDLLPGVDGGDGTVQFSAEAGAAGSSIRNIFVDGIGNTDISGAAARIEAGAGGAGAKGGSVSNVRIVEDSSGFSIRAGAGGNGSASGSAAGGAGGTVTKVYVAGLPDFSPGDLIDITAGDGGAAASGTDGVGGKGGAVSKVYVGFQLIGAKPFQTLDPLNDQIHVASGDGGEGRNGGAGGKINKVELITTVPNVAGEEISIIAGSGGASTASGVGKGGKGGWLTAVSARDLAIEGDTPLETTILLQAGSGGLGNTTANGGIGGSIMNTTLIGAGYSVLAGNGGNGRVGGAGGSISNVDTPISEGVVSHRATFSAGFGGDGGSGNGGKGGAVENVRNEFGDFTEYLINPGNSGNGGNSLQARGGAGGAVTRLDLFDGFSNASSSGIFSVRSGDGGNGLRGAGVGGALTKSQFVSLDMNLDIRSGSGGDISGSGANGSGARGGVLKTVQVQAESSFSTPVTVAARSGSGGVGVGAQGAGGDAGDIKSLNIRYSGTVLVQGGDGGSGDGGAAGDGGSIVLSGAFGTIGVAGNGSMLGGNAGATGSAPGAGGSIRGASAVRLTGLYANDDVTIKAGDGSNGGAGGSIEFVGYGGTNDETLQPSPLGNILVQGGAGSAEGRFAGAGGAINSVTGSVASGADSITNILAGNGAGVSTNASAGGSITNLTVFLGGGDGAELRIKAGDAGDAGSAASKGANGGQLKNITVSEIDELTLFRSIAAGDGGDAGSVGGTGGSIKNVRVLNHEIGVLLAEEYGYDTMGGVFAGAGGNAAQDGKAGSVDGLTATAIAAIVAGREAAPALVERVENVYVGTPRSTGQPITNLLLVRDGDIDQTDGGDPIYGRYVLERYLTGNFVGATVDPVRVDANKFRFRDINGVEVTGREFDPSIGDRPIDGLIAAKFLDQKTINFTAEASLIGAVLNDWDNLVL